MFEIRKRIEPKSVKCSILKVYGSVEKLQFRSVKVFFDFSTQNCAVDLEFFKNSGWKSRRLQLISYCTNKLLKMLIQGSLQQTTMIPSPRGRVLLPNSEEWWQHWPIYLTQNYRIHIVIKWKLFPNWGQNFRIGFFLTLSILK